ncbi:hypothetical protein HN903_03680 [archaeon]|nr:hypothetical protein [archaeon]MBT7128830.1 hypothetical protein [archaeon]
MLKIFIVLVFLIGFVSAVDVDLDCPNEVFVDEEFECEVEVSEGDARYDLKVEVDKERDSILRIWDGYDGNWQSGYYYLKEFIEDDEDVKLKVVEAGRYDVVVKLRDGEWREEFDVGRIKVRESKVVEEGDMVESVDDVSIILDDVEPEVISLSGDVIEDVEDKWDYVSKDGLVVDWLPYVFCLFLIFFVGILVWSQVA